MENPTVRYETSKGVARILINRPERRNAFDADIIAELTALLEQATQDNKVRVIVLGGEGAHFSAGADLGWMKSTAQLSEEENRADAMRLSKLMQTLDELPKPTIARVQGAAFGGALGLVCACDMAFATQTARFCLSEVRLGLSPAVISPYVVRALGLRNARRFFLSAEEIPASQADSLGLVHEVIAEDLIDERIDQLTRIVTQNGPQALAATKSLLREVETQYDSKALRRFNANLIATLRVGAEAQEGLTAFFEKRAPAWRQLED